MFGDALLVSPVVAPGERMHKVYLPAGEWYDYFRGARWHGGKTIDYPVDSASWQDIPLFIRSGSIVASQPSQDYTDQYPVAEIALDVFPSAQPAQFTYYDDDGTTYAYEKGVYYRQPIRASTKGLTANLSFGEPSGAFKPPLRFWLVRVHSTTAASVVLLNGKPLAKVPASRSGASSFWSEGRDRFGPVTTMRIPAQQASSIVLR